MQIYIYLFIISLILITINDKFKKKKKENICYNLFISIIISLLILLVYYLLDINNLKKPINEFNVNKLFINTEPANF